MVMDSVISEKDVYDGLDPVLQKEYEEKGGKWWLKVKASRVGKQLWALEDVAGLKTAVDKQKKEVANLTRLVDGLKGDNDELPDPDTVRDALEKVKQIEKMTPNEKVQETVKAREAALQKKFEGEKETLSGVIKKLQSRVEELRVPSEASRLLASEKFKGSSAKLLMPAILGRAKIEWDKEFNDSLNVFDENGQMMINPDAGETGSATMDHLLDAMKGDSEYSRGFGGTMASGTGQGSTDGTSIAGGIRKLTPEEAGDPRKYEQLKAACDKAGVNVLDYLPEA